MPEKFRVDMWRALPVLKQRRGEKEGRKEKGGLGVGFNGVCLDNIRKEFRKIFGRSSERYSFIIYSN
jgi:hypothetical protein